MKRWLFQREKPLPQPGVPYFWGPLLGEVEVRSKVIEKNSHVTGIAER